MLSFIGLLLILIPQLVFGSIEDDALKFVRGLEKVPAVIEAQELINQCSTCVPNLKSEQTPNQAPIPELDHKIKYLIFISFSMPPDSIKLLYSESLNQNATLVMRGLLDGSFKKTAAKLQSLNVVAQINPKLFKKYQIERVPTIVAVAGNVHHSIAGNMSFIHAKERLLEAR